MGDKSCVVIYGLDELASAVGRMLLLAGHAVAMHAASPPVVLRRRMAFSDAWYDGVATLEGVEARRADRDADLVTGLRSSMFIPVLTHPSFEAVGRWPWDVIIDARGALDSGRMGNDAELCVVLGPGASAGTDCDVVIETGGMDPGAVVRSGRAICDRTEEPIENPVAAVKDGIFHAESAIGDVVAAGNVLGFIGSVPIPAASSGRLRGLARSWQAVRGGEVIAEITANKSAPVNAIDRIHKLIARSVAFTIEMEQQGLTPNVWGRTGLRKGK
jgi:xanthine dehydrogenase accessory factor